MIDLVKTVNDAVDLFVSENKQFTAYDVTKYVRSKNKGENIPHYLVRNAVVNYFTNNVVDDYEVENVDVDGVTARLYANGNSDVADYDPKWVDSFSGVAAVSTIPPVDTASPVVTPSSPVVAPSKVQRVLPVANAGDVTNVPLGVNQQRLCIPPKHVRAAGLKDGAEVVLIETDNAETLLLDKSVLSNYVAIDGEPTLVVTEGSRIRIPSSYLKSAGGLFSVQTIDCKTYGKGIKVWK